MRFQVVQNLGTYLQYKVFFGRFDQTVCLKKQYLIIWSFIVFQKTYQELMSQRWLDSALNAA